MKELVGSYAAGFEQVEQAVSGLSDAQISYKPAPDSWSIHEVIVHLADNEMVSIHRMKKVLSEQDPLLTSYDQDLWANRTQYMKLDYKQQFALLKLLRESFVTLLQHITQNDLSRTGVHSEAGKMTLQQILQNNVKHLQVHIRQIERVKQQGAS